ncbi:hypothetical protein GCM10022380_50790 [Amycolatopsis tucumanensis]|uniref:Uncharacterized protein n=1 Tax=Amycolatopsis tucumanensis TaxID=401106 RepID=A0ABP7ISH5_9PSEU
MKGFGGGSPRPGGRAVSPRPSGSRSARTLRTAAAANGKPRRGAGCSGSGVTGPGWLRPHGRVRGAGANSAPGGAQGATRAAAGGKPADLSGDNPVRIAAEASSDLSGGKPHPNGRLPSRSPKQPPPASPSGHEPSPGGRARPRPGRSPRRVGCTG